MKVIIAGSRAFTDAGLVERAIRASGFRIEQVVSGAGDGIDTLGERWAERNNISVQKFPADWRGFGRSAGPRRNLQMAQYANALIAIPGPDSVGTLDMISKATARGLRVYIHREGPLTQGVLFPEPELTRVKHPREVGLTAPACNPNWEVRGSDKLPWE